MARFEGDFKKEKSLYNSLITLFRSPEMLLKLTGTSQVKKQEE